MNTMKLKKLIFSIILYCAIAMQLKAQDTGNPFFTRSFDSEEDGDVQTGYVTFQNGIKGRAVNLDGYTSFIEVPNRSVKNLNQDFTMEAWIALQEYPWNWSGIFDNYRDKTGVFFGVNAFGKVGLFLGDGKNTTECVSDITIPHLMWTHVAATVDSNNGITLYVNGEKAGFLEYKGNFKIDGESDFWIGRSHVDTYPENTEREVCMQYQSRMILDGMLDELNIYDVVLNEDQIRGSFNALKPSQIKALEWRKLPKGPDDLPNRFGAYYTRLNYDDEWERPWRVSEHPDILITFRDSPVRLIFWRGFNYGITWITENDIYTGNQSMEYYTEASGCNEHMADKQCRYSHVRIIEKNDARVVVHWRYALTSVEYGFPEFDEATNWGDWGDEYITIYPDGVAVRKQILHSHRFTQTWNDEYSDGQYNHYQFNEMFVFSQPGQSPHQNIDTGGITLATLDGSNYTYRIDQENPPNLKNALLKVINTKSDNKSFAIFQPGSVVQSWVEDDYFTWNHWPVAQLPSDGRFSTANDRPAHTALSNAAPVWISDGNRHTAVSLYGMNYMGLDELVSLGKSWNYPCEASSPSEGLDNKGYDPYERAYVFEHIGNKPFGDTEISFAASKENPFVNNALILKNVDEVNYDINTSNRDIQFKFGYKDTMSGRDLVIWLDHITVEPFSISISK
jgi:hypothetical protein